MTTGGNATVFLKNSPKLRVDFYESGIGETIVVTFPSGGIGLIDAHPTQHRHRPEILQILNGKRLHFACLTHPHADHGLDLVEVLQKHPAIDEFWHTIFDIPAIIYGVGQMVNFPSPVKDYAAKMNQDWGKFMLDIFSAVIDRDITPHHLRSDLQAHIIDGIEVYCLSPDESVHNAFTKAYRKKLKDIDAELPDANLISAVLALRLGESVVLLGADALKKNWESAVKHYRKHSLPKARILKVPHHGAKNALELKRGAASYLDVCSIQPKAKAVLFAGDSKHPNDEVFEKLKSRTDTICLSNGRKQRTVGSNPLNLQLPGAQSVLPAPVCNPVVSFELDSNGNVTCLAGADCLVACPAQGGRP